MARSTLAGMVLATWMCVSALAFAADAPAPQRVELDVIGELSIDAAGGVVGVEFAPDVPAPIASIVKQAVGNWKFEPVLHDGVAAPAKSTMHLFLVGVPQPGGFRMRVERAQFGFTRKIVQTGHKPGNTLPKDAIRAGVQSEVLLAVHIDAAGKVLDVVPLRSRLIQGVKAPSRLADKWRSGFETSAMALMRDAKFEPADPRLPGDGTTALVTNMSAYREGLPVPVASVWTQQDTAVNFTGIPAWLGGGKIADGAIDRVGDGQTVAFGNGPVLRTQVVGTLL